MCPLRWQSHSSSSRKRSKTTASTHPKVFFCPPSPHIPPLTPLPPPLPFPNIPTTTTKSPWMKGTEDTDRHPHTAHRWHVTPPSQPPLIPSLTSLQNNMVSCNSRARWPTYSHHHPVIPPTPLYMCSSCCVWPAHQTNTDGLAGPLEQKPRNTQKAKRGERREKEGRRFLFAWALLHACRSSGHHLG